jgi:hypothetical protein
VNGLEAEILLDYDESRIAEAVALAVSPDNFKTPKGLSVITDCIGKQVVTKINCKEKFVTFIATVDDFLFCVSTAEKALKIAEKLE